MRETSFGRRQNYRGAPCYRLMALSRTARRPYEVMTGSLIYLLRMARQLALRSRGQGRRLRGRRWIELSTEPALRGGFTRKPQSHCWVAV